MIFRSKLLEYTIRFISTIQISNHQGLVYVTVRIKTQLTRSPLGYHKVLLALYEISFAVQKLQKFWNHCVSFSNSLDSENKSILLNMAKFSKYGKTEIFFKILTSLYDF